MYFDTVNYASVLRAFESLGHTADSCLSQQQFSSALDHLVRKRYPSQNFDEIVAQELFEQNQKGFDGTVKVSSYAMSVVTAYQILMDRISKQTANKGGSDLVSYEAAEVVKQCRRDVESLMMAFGTKHPAEGPLHESVAQMAHNLIGQSWIPPTTSYPGSLNAGMPTRPQQMMSSQPIIPQRSPYQPMQGNQPVPQQPMQMPITQQPIQMAQQPQVQPQQMNTQMQPIQMPQKQPMQYNQPQNTIQYQAQPSNQQMYVQQQVVTTQKKQQKKQEEKKQEKKQKKQTKKSVQALVSIVSALSLIQLVLSGHKYYAVNLPMGLTGLAVAAAGLKSNMVTYVYLFFLSAAIILSIYWQAETIYNHSVHVPHVAQAVSMPATAGVVPGAHYGTPIGQPVLTQPGVVSQPNGQIPVAPQFMCIQDAAGLCTLVQAVSPIGQQVIDTSRPPPPAPVVTSWHNFTLNLGFFLFIDVLKIVVLIFVAFNFGDDDQKKDQKKEQVKEQRVQIIKKVV